MAGNIKDGYAASTAPAVTNLHSLASSQDWTAGWCSASISNLTDLFDDYLKGATFTTHASNRQAGVINVYVVASLNDTPLYPATATGTLGTEGTVSFTDTEERDAACRLLVSIAVDTTASAIVVMPQLGIAALFNGTMPTHHCLFIASNASTTTTAGLASSGSAVYSTGHYKTYT